MRRQFTIQLYDLPVHAHICPECDECIPCRLPCCWTNNYDSGAPRVCEPCRQHLLLGDAPLVDRDWCEHCGGDLLNVNQLAPEHWASEPHNAWCLVGIEAERRPHPPPMAQVSVQRHGSSIVITARVDIEAGDRLILQGVPTEVIGVAVQAAKAGDVVTVRLT